MRVDVQELTCLDRNKKGLYCTLHMFHRGEHVAHGEWISRPIAKWANRCPKCKRQGCDASQTMLGLQRMIVRTCGCLVEWRTRPKPLQPEMFP